MRPAPCSALSGDSPEALAGSPVTRGSPEAGRSPLGEERPGDRGGWLANWPEDSWPGLGAWVMAVFNGADLAATVLQFSLFPGAVTWALHTWEAGGGCPGPPRPRPPQTTWGLISPRSSRALSPARVKLGAAGLLIPRSPSCGDTGSSSSPRPARGRRAAPEYESAGPRAGGSGRAGPAVGAVSVTCILVRTNWKGGGSCRGYGCWETRHLLKRGPPCERSLQAPRGPVPGTQGTLVLKCHRAGGRGTCAVARRRSLGSGTSGRAASPSCWHGCGTAAWSPVQAAVRPTPWMGGFAEALPPQSPLPLLCDPPGRRSGAGALS